MSFYYKYNFISADQIFAEIKEEMDSYFSTGIVDDVMFFTYLNHALSKLGPAVDKIEETPLHLENYSATLPADFKLVRELWLCTDVVKILPEASSYYDARTCKLVPNWGEYNPCDPCDTCTDGCTQTKSIVFKTTGEIISRFAIHSLLTPGNVSVKSKCSKDCRNYGASSPWSFDIKDNKVITNISHGMLYMIYYQEALDDNGFTMVPDNFRIQEYVKSYIKYKLYERLWNSVTDETMNQIERKYLTYRDEANDNYILADIEIKKPTTQQNINRIKAQRSGLNKYKIR